MLRPGGAAYAEVRVEINGVPLQSGELRVPELRTGSDFTYTAGTTYVGFLCAEEKDECEAE